MTETRRTRNRWGEGSRLRGDILAAARRLLEQDGTEAAVTLRGVARAVGITAPAIYVHFPDRDRLLEVVITSIWNDVADVVAAALNGLPEDTDPLERLRVRLRAYIAFAHQHPASYQVLFTRHNPSPMPAVAKLSVPVFEQFRSEVAAAAPHLDREDSYLTAVALWAGLHGLAALPPHHPRFKWPDMDNLIDRLLRDHLLPAGLPTAAQR